MHGFLDLVRVIAAYKYPGYVRFKQAHLPTGQQCRGKRMHQLRLTDQLIAWVAWHFFSK
jgi:hypothetical protein